MTGPAVEVATEQAQAAAERAEFDRLARVLAAHQRATEPGREHCFCGSVADLRRLGADIDPDHPETGQREPDDEEIE